MNVYIVAHCRWAAEYVSGELDTVAIGVTSTWHQVPFNPTSCHTIAERVAVAELDKKEIDKADAVVLIATDDKVTGGKFVEAGIAMGQNKPVLVLGRRENMLMWHPSVKSFEELPGLIQELKVLRNSFFN